MVDADAGSANPDRQCFVRFPVRYRSCNYAVT